MFVGYIDDKGEGNIKYQPQALLTNCSDIFYMIQSFDFYLVPYQLYVYEFHILDHI